MPSETWSPTELDDALALKAEHGAALTVLAGGTDVMVYLQARVMSAPRVLDIYGIDALRGIRREGDTLIIGALESYTAIIQSPLVQAAAPTLVDASRTVGAIQIQNRGTLGGNLANGSPAADTPPVLLASDAVLRLVKRGSERLVPVTSFFHGYKQLELADDELIADVRLPCKTEADRDWFVKVGTRRAQAISKVVMAGRARINADGTIAAAALSAGSVAPTTIRLPSVESVMIGRKPDAALENDVRRLAGEAVIPIDDVRSTVSYRRTVSGNVAAQFVRYLRESS